MTVSRAEYLVLVVFDCSNKKMLPPGDIRREYDQISIEERDEVVQRLVKKKLLHAVNYRWTLTEAGLAAIRPNRVRVVTRRRS
jgi:hypothetical protein